jgi:hypothetical protein
MITSSLLNDPLLFLFEVPYLGCLLPGFAGLGVFVGITLSEEG